MKSFVALGSFLVFVSLACSTSRSAGTERVANDNVEVQSTTTTSNPNQEKQPCTLKLAGAPALNGIRLGMTTDEMLALFPGSKDDAEVRAGATAVTRFGNATVVIRPDQFQSKQDFPGISQITFRLMDGRVYEFTISYDGPEYSHVDKFVAKVVERTGLPAADQWDAYVGMDNSLKTLKCTEFEVNVFIGGEGGKLNYVSVKDLVADKTLKDRRAKARAQQSPTPSP